jgi:aminopeptidase N
MNTETPQNPSSGLHTAALSGRSCELDVQFHADAKSWSSSHLRLRRNPAVGPGQPLQLDGHGLATISVAVDGTAARRKRLHMQRLGADHRRSAGLRCSEHAVRIDADHNTSLSGLYRSKDGYFTQCEAQGFRRITWFPDRPDIMSRYVVTLHADKASLPVLLANGNPVGSGDEGPIATGRAGKIPFAKPCYLFALVAARLDVLRDRFTTGSGRSVELAVYRRAGQARPVRARDGRPAARDALGRGRSSASNATSTTT